MGRREPSARPPRPFAQRHDLRDRQRSQPTWLQHEPLRIMAGGSSATTCRISMHGALGRLGTCLSQRDSRTNQDHHASEVCDSWPAVGCFVTPRGVGGS